MRKFIVYLGVFLGVLAGPLHAEAITFDELWSTNIFDSTSWTPESLQGYFAESGFNITTDQAAQIIALEDAGNVDESRAFALQSVTPSAPPTATIESMIAGVGGGVEAAAYNAAAPATARFVFQELVMPTPPTLLQLKQADLDTAKKARSIGASGRFQTMDFDDAEDGEVYGLNLGLVLDEDNLSYGFMYAYEYMDFESLYVGRNHLIGFVQQHYSLAESLTAATTEYLNYIYSYIDYDNGDHASVNTGGGGISGSLTYDRTAYFATLGLSYSFNIDDTNAENDKQHLLKSGLVLGTRIGENSVVDLSFVYNYDLTDYDDSSVDDDYYEVGLGLRHDFTETWSATVGYKKVLGIDDFDSNEYVLGSNWKF